MREWVTFVVSVSIFLCLLFGFVTCVDTANSTEPITLEAVLERGGVAEVHKYVDKPNGVVCYWRGRSIFLTCLHVTSNRVGVR